MPDVPSPTPASTAFPVLDAALALRASDLKLISGRRPVTRSDHGLQPAPDAIDEATFKQILSFAQGRHKEAAWMGRTDGAFEYRGYRWRFKHFTCSRGPTLALRIIPPTRQEPNTLGIPAAFMPLLHRPNGLVLVTGPTGSGKSTTLAACLDYLNKHFERNVNTVENPIENTFEDDKCVFCQMELGTHFAKWEEAISTSLRTDPDVIVIGEMIDLDTIRAAITAAETGHLVLSTLHTRDAASTLTRLADSLRDEPDLLSKLADSLLGVLSQKRLPLESTAPATAFGRKTCVYELLVSTPAVANGIRQGRTIQIRDEIQKGSSLGMISFDQALLALARERVISNETALNAATSPEELKSRLPQIQPSSK